MDPIKKIPASEKTTLNEPIYVDDVFTEEEDYQDEPWDRDEDLKNLNLDATIEELLIQANINEGQTNPPTNSISTARFFRLKKTLSSPCRHQSTPRIPYKKPASMEIPLIHRLGKNSKDHSKSWPVAPNSKRNGNGNPKKGVVQSTFYAPERVNKQEKPASQRISVVKPVIEIENPVDITHKSESQSTPAQKSTSKNSPPPVLPIMPIRPIENMEGDPENKPPQPLFHNQKQAENKTFQPLVDDITVEKDFQDQEQLGANPLRRSKSELHELIDRLHLPGNSMVLGVCDDGLPLLLEFSDPSPGAILFLAEDITGTQKHLQSVLTSVGLLSDSNQFRINVISPTPTVFSDKNILPNIQKLLLPEQDEVYDLLGTLFETIEQRQRKDNSLTGRILNSLMPDQKGQVQILLIDQIDVLINHLAPESLAYLRWLLRRGSLSNVWILASLNTKNGITLDTKTLKAFGLKVTGKIQVSNEMSQITELTSEQLNDLSEGEAFLKLDNEAIRFSILEI